MSAWRIPPWNGDSWTVLAKRIIGIDYRGGEGVLLGE
jgi:hypothetical protein